MQVASASGVSCERKERFQSDLMRALTVDDNLKLRASSRIEPDDVSEQAVTAVGGHSHWLQGIALWRGFANGWRF